MQGYRNVGRKSEEENCTEIPSPDRVYCNPTVVDLHRDCVKFRGPKTGFDF